MFPIHCGHLDAVSAVVALSAEKRWKRQDFAYFLAHPNSYCVGVPGPGGSLRAFCLSLLCDGVLDLIYIATAPKERQKGLSRGLLQVFQNDPRVSRITLEVAEGNLPALALYGSSGFLPAGRRRRYYENRYDALLFEWQRR
ncbi:MAG: GNAT family N-acetyltransferase [Bdellovibrionota bacterium]